VIDILKKKIAVITGARSEFGIIELVIEEIIKSEVLDIDIYITGMHLLKKYGYTANIILERNYPNVKIVPFYNENQSPEELSYSGVSIANGVKQFTDVLYKDQPDIVLISGDRVEVIAVCIAAASLGIAIAHIHGGDVSENAQIDEQIRHAITKFSHLHFAASELSKKRILQMGEEGWRTSNTGSPEIDYIVNIPLFSKKELLDELEINDKVSYGKKLVLCLQHPNIFQAEKSGVFMGEILENLKDLGENVIIIYPNNDPGSNLIISEIERYRNEKIFHIFVNLSRKIFLSLMKHAYFMIGNSSSAIIETASFKLPVLNIGIRNLNRECSENVLSIENGKDSIKKGISKITSNKFIERCSNVESVYGDGQASKKINKILENIKIDEKLFKKKFVLYK
jgi:GDP/UDP-N,N'-diacetylbacillosamine 2-epimerase (hydrolysing)